jgi:alkylated DNA repair protein (DNA oxidative demethylase)
VPRRAARPIKVELIAALRDHHQGAISPHVHARRPSDVGGDDQLRRGWVTDRSGYRYDPLDPESGQAWPSMPPVFSRLAAEAAEEGGFKDFAPDVCLINRYGPSARMSLHQDKDELDFAAPIVSVSLGLPAIFLFGGSKRSDRPRRFRLQHGDVVVWGGPSRLFFHGVAPLADGEHAVLGRQRINLTFRKAR